MITFHVGFFSALTAGLFTLLVVQVCILARLTTGSRVGTTIAMIFNTIREEPDRAAYKNHIPAMVIGIDIRAFLPLVVLLSGTGTAAPLVIMAASPAFMVAFFTILLTRYNVLEPRTASRLGKATLASLGIIVAAALVNGIVSIFPGLPVAPLSPTRAVAAVIAAIGTAITFVVSARKARDLDSLGLASAYFNNTKAIQVFLVLLGTFMVMEALTVVGGGSWDPVIADIVQLLSACLMQVIVTMTYTTVRHAT